MTSLIDTFLAMDEIECIKAQADRTRTAVERKIAQCSASYREVTIYGENALARADEKIAQINTWNAGKPLFTTVTRDTYRATVVGRTDIRRDLDDASEYFAAAAEWMGYARKVEADASIVAIAA